MPGGRVGRRSKAREKRRAARCSAILFLLWGPLREVYRDRIGGSTNLRTTMFQRPLRPGAAGKGSLMKRKIPAAVTILGAMVIGVIIGYMIFVNYPDKKSAAELAGYISLVSDIFLRLIKMLIAPLVFSTLVVGIAHMGDASSVGRVFAKSLGWFVTASLISLLLG